MTPWVAARDLWCTYGTKARVDALRGVSLWVERGEFVAITGPSGSGKSTLLYTLGGLRAPTAGTRVVCGYDQPDVATMTRLRRREIGFVFQSFHLLTKRSALDNVAMGGRYSAEPRRARLRRARELLTRLGLGDRLDHTPRQLSGGEQQRVAIARSLLMEPSLLLADEPTGNLDSATGTEIMETLADAHRRGTTVILVTHDPRAAAYAERTISILDGAIVTGAAA